MENLLAKFTTVPVVHLTGNDTNLASPETATAKAFCEAAPCIQVGFFFDQDVWLGTSKKLNYTSVLALIDTGSPHVYVDKSLVQQYDCPPARGGQKMTYNNRPAEPAREGQLFIIEQSRVINLWVGVRDLVAEGHQHKIVLGRRFLQFCNLTWDGANQKVALEVGDHTPSF